MQKTIRTMPTHKHVTVAEAALLVVLVIFLFLREWRAVVIPLVTIPVPMRRSAAWR